jgi:hypothetical protein
MIAEKIFQYMQHAKLPFDRNPLHVNIVYVEGVNADLSRNTDQIDFWNDRRLVLQCDKWGTPQMLLSAACTTEPGLAATQSAAAKKRGGVARVQFGQFTAWRVGFHQQTRLGTQHPALVQVMPLQVFRDANQDGIRPGDKLSPAWGINQHGTRLGLNPARVGMWSEGCLVGRDWQEHMKFMELVKSDERYKKNRNHIFTTTIISGSELNKYLSSQAPTMPLL